MRCVSVSTDETGDTLKEVINHFLRSAIGLYADTLSNQWIVPYYCAYLYTFSELPFVGSSMAFKVGLLGAGDVDRLLIVRARTSTWCGTLHLSAKVQRLKAHEEDQATVKEGKSETRKPRRRRQ